MEKYIDLHTHTNMSDGSMSPTELVMHAKTAGLSAIAITDHDTIDGVAAAVSCGNKIGIEVVAGVEISVDFNHELHFLGYFFDNNYLNIAPVLELLKQERAQRNAKIIDKLNQLGFDLSINDIDHATDKSVIGRGHIAKALVKKGYAKSVQDAFDKYLAYQRPAYVARTKFSVEQAIHYILNAGGIPVLAHPKFLGLSPDQLDNLISDFSKLGLCGIETYYSENTELDTLTTLQIANKYNLLITGGSDFHGTLKPDIQIGVGRGNLKVPYRLLDDLKAFRV